MSRFSNPDEAMIGILLAAGRGKRMGRTKQLMPWPPGSRDDGQGSTVVAAAFDAIASFCNQMLVVLGHEAPAVAAALGNRRFDSLRADPDAEMFDSIRLGLGKTRMISGVSAAMLHPADQPALSSQTIRILIEHHRLRPAVAIMPEFNGKGGHPVIIPRNLFDHILEFNQPGGLREFWIRHPEFCLRVPVDDPGAIADLDAPKDYFMAGHRE